MAMSHPLFSHRCSTTKTRSILIPSSTPIKIEDRIVAVTCERVINSKRPCCLQFRDCVWVHVEEFTRVYNITDNESLSCLVGLYSSEWNWNADEKLRMKFEYTLLYNPVIFIKIVEIDFKALSFFFNPKVVGRLSLENIFEFGVRIISTVARCNQPYMLHFQYEEDRFNNQQKETSLY